MTIPMAHMLLGDADRKRYGLPDTPIEFEPFQFGLRALKALRTQTGFTIDYLNHQMGGVPKLDEHGNPVPRLDDDGEPELDDDGEPRFVVERDEEAVAAYVWLVLWAAGHRIDWDTFDVNPVGLRIVHGEDPEQGKGEQPETDSASTSSTSG